MQIKKFYPLIFSVLVVLLIRVGLSFFPSFGSDMSSWMGWARQLSLFGMSKFYVQQSGAQYTPAFLYYLWIIGKLGWVNPVAIKIPVTLADIGVGVMIWSLIRKVNPRYALTAFFLYTLNPVTLFVGPIWGQIDGILTLFLFLSAYFLIEKENFPLSAVLWSVAFLIKPQSISVAPAFLLFIFLGRVKWRQVFWGIVLSAITIFFLSWPFFGNNPILGLPSHILSMGKLYPYTSLFAYNLWSWVGFWKPDTALFLGLNLSVWGGIFWGVAILLTLYVFKNKLDKRENGYLLFAVLCLSFFLFPTRVHERYIFPFFAFLLTAVGISKSRNLFGIYVATSLLSFLNLYYPYSYYYPEQLRSEALFGLSRGMTKIIGLFFWPRIFFFFGGKNCRRLTSQSFLVAGFRS